ncbi:MAG: foldase protein PrsA [Opitutales bacterium]
MKLFRPNPRFSACVAILLFGVGPGSPVHAQAPLPRDAQYAQWEARFENGIAAIVEGRIITMDELRREMAPIIPQVYRDSRSPQEFQRKVDELSREVLQNLIDRVLIVKAFREKEEMRIPKSIVENEFDRILITDFGGDRSQFLEYLKEQNKTVAEYRRDLEERIIVSVMRGQNRKSMSEISPERIEQFYNQHKIRFYQEDSIHLRQIVLAPYAEEGEDLLMQNARKIIDQLNAGARFSEMARRHSQDEMSRKGGDWGWIERSDIRPELADLAFDLEAGDFSDPILLEGRVFILYVEEKRGEGIQPLPVVRDTIERFINAEIARETQQQWLEQLRADGYVKYFL